MCWVVEKDQHAPRRDRWRLVSIHDGHALDSCSTKKEAVSMMAEYNTPLWGCNCSAKAKSSPVTVKN